MQRIVVLFLLVLLALATPVSASNVMGWTGAVIAQNAIQSSSCGASIVSSGVTWNIAPIFGNILGNRETKATLGLKAFIWASGSKMGDGAFAKMQVDNTEVKLPEYHDGYPVLSNFRYVHVEMKLGYPGEVNWKRVNWQALIDSGCCKLNDKCITVDTCGNLTVEMDGNKGPFTIEIYETNTMGKKQIVVDLWLVKGTFATGRSANQEKVIIPFNVFPAGGRLDAYTERLSKGKIMCYDKLKAIDECNKDQLGQIAVETGVVETAMPEWFLEGDAKSAIGTDYNTLEYNWRNRHADLWQPVASSSGGWQSMQPPAGGQPPMGSMPMPGAPAPTPAVAPQAPMMPAQPLAAPAPAPAPPAPVKDPQPKVHLLNYVSDTTTSNQEDPNQIAFSFMVVKDGKAYNGQDIALHFYGAKDLAGMSTDGKIWAHADRSDIGQDQWYMVYQDGKPVGKWQWFKIQGDGESFNLNLVTAQEVAAR